MIVSVKPMSVVARLKLGVHNWNLILMSVGSRTGGDTMVIALSLLNKLNLCFFCVKNE